MVNKNGDLVEIKLFGNINSKKVKILVNKGDFVKRNENILFYKLSIIEIIQKAIFINISVTNDKNKIEIIKTYEKNINKGDYIIAII